MCVCRGSEQAQCAEKIGFSITSTTKGKSAVVQGLDRLGRVNTSLAKASYKTRTYALRLDLLKSF